MHEHLDWLAEAVYAMGYQAALHDIPARHAELDTARRPMTGAAESGIGELREDRSRRRYDG